MGYRVFGWEEIHFFSIRPASHVVSLAETKETILSDLLSGTPRPPLSAQGKISRDTPSSLSISAFTPCLQEEGLKREIHQSLPHQRLRFRLKADWFFSSMRLRSLARPQPPS